jgi:ubiquitin C-terminal hydrolase
MSPEAIECLFSPVATSVEPGNQPSKEFGDLVDPPEAFRFPNIGGTCYLSTCIQLLFHLSWPGGFCGMFEARLHDIFNIIYYLYELRQVSCNDTMQVTQGFHRIRDLLHREKLDSQSQQDPQEVLMYVLDKICLSCPRAESALMGQIHEITEHELQGHVTEVDLPFIMLHFNVPAGRDTTFHALIHDWKKASFFHNEHDDSWITRTVSRLPPILLIALDRLQWTHGVQQKNQVCVQLPMTLLASAFIDIDEERTYHLSGIIVHQGRLDGRGNMDGLHR